MNRHNERAELIQAIRNQLGDDFDPSDCFYEQGFLHRAAAMLEAQPAEQVNGQEAAGGAALRPDYEQIIDNYIDDYEMRGETEDGYDTGYTPNENDKSLLKDAFMGFDFSALCATPPAQPAREWVGLTDEKEIMALAVKSMYLNKADRPGATQAAKLVRFAIAIDAALREKNAGLPAAVPDDIPAILKKQAS